MQRVVYLQVGGVLMALLALVPGAGGLELLVQGRTADPGILATGALVRAVGAGLLGLALALFVSAAGVLRLRRWAWGTGVASTAAFVAAGAIRRYALSGQVGERALLMDAAAAALVLLPLAGGRRALDTRTLFRPSFTDPGEDGGPRASTPAPARGEVTFDAESIRCTVGGTTGELRWDCLERVAIRTTDQGPLLDDAFFVLSGEGRNLVCPSEARGARELLERLQELPGFDNGAVIEAMTCIEDGLFVCWERPEGTAGGS